MLREVGMGIEASDGNKAALRSILKKMSENKAGVKVKLKINMTKYHKDLVPGLEGFTVPPAGNWSQLSDRFVSVRFPSVTVDVLWRHLEVTDEKILAAHLALVQQENERILNGLRRAVKYVGLKGAFKYLIVEYVDQSGSPYVVTYGGATKNRGLELLEILKANNKEVLEEQE